jgi:DNA primase
MDELAYIQTLNLKKHGSNQLSGSCPLCGGHDRFVMFIDGRYRCICRHCNLGQGTGSTKAMTIPKLFATVNNITYHSAVGILGLEKKTATFDKQKLMPKFNRKESKPYRDHAIQTNEIWQARATQTHYKAHKALLNSEKSMDWLTNVRKLDEAAIKLNYLGLIENDILEHRILWGLKNEATRDKLSLKSGILIPSFNNGKLIRLRIRLHKPINKNKYWVVSGSEISWSQYGEYKEGENVIICESDLDAILLNRLLKITTFASTSACISPDKKTYEKLQKSKYVFDAMDADGKALHTISIPLFKMLGSKYIRLIPLKGNDPTDSMRAGINLKDWIKAGLQIARMAS